ncbi:MAG: SPFH domain-containing protein [Clostridia bacterium]|nr:SPFH domain-containing protein [Clostridia bacterium]
MGLIKAVTGAVGGVLADQWKEFFYCEAIDKNTIMVKGQKRITSRSTNTKGNDNIISNGSGIAVADGQCMIIVEQGKIVEVCAEPGEFTYNSSTEPSIFTGKLSTSIKETFKIVGRRIAYGGDTGKDQRVYYFNIKELVDNKFGTQNPIPFRVVDRNIGLDADMGLRCNGVYSYKVADPLLFYTNVCGNVTTSYSRDEIDNQLKTEFLTALQPAFAKISEQGIRYSALPGHTMELCDAMNEVLTAKWRELRGLEIVSVGINSATLTEEDEATIKDLQKKAVYRDASMGAAAIVDAQAEAMKDAANNPNGSMMGFMGLGFAQQAGGANAQSLYGVAAEQQKQAAAAAPAAEAPAGWKCSCGATATGNFCPECGSPRPVADEGWKCSCGAVNKGKFCSECGAKKPAGAPLYRCDKCGWTPEDPHNPPKFCPECGDPFDDSDAQ